MVLDYRFEEDGHPRHKESRNVENVLVLQGGGSLGALACGVFKALVKKNVRIDIVAGTSIGAVNFRNVLGSKKLPAMSFGSMPVKFLIRFCLDAKKSLMHFLAA